MPAAVPAAADRVHGDPVGPILDDLRRWARGEATPPFRLFAYLTERCNLRCPSCGLATGRIVPPERELPDAAVVALAAAADRLGVREGYLTGGEVLVRGEAALAFMQRLKRAGIRGVLSTNGTLLDAATRARLLAIGWDLLIVSLDGPDAATNDALRSRAGVFDQVTAAVRALVAGRAGGGRDPRLAGRPELHLHTVISRRNVRALTAMVDLAADLAVDYLAAEPIVRQSDACAPMLLTADDRAALRAELPRARARAAALGVASNLGFLADDAFAAAPTDTASINAADVRALADRDVGGPAARLAALPCFVPFYNLVVHPDGAVAGCWQQRDADAPRLPDVSLTDAWYEGPPARLRRALLAGETPDFCRRCCLVNARDNRRYRALLLADDGPPQAARDALRTAIAAEPELPILRDALARLDVSAAAPPGAPR